MTFRQYAVFHLQAPDVVLFAQAMWNTLQGDFLYSTLTYKTVLAHHFTPIFGLVAPVLWVWEDPRALFLVQTAGLAACGLILWRIAKEVIPKWALLITALFYLNAALHEVAIQELRRIPFAAPFIALALFGLVKDKMWPLLIGLFFALLAKEDVGILLFTFGLFAFFFLKRRVIGGALALSGVVLTAMLTFCVIPSFDLIERGFGCYPTEYDQLNYFLESDVSETDNTGGVFEAVGETLLNPIALFGRIFDQAGLLALLRILLPFAIIFPLLGWKWTLLAAPSVAAMMLSTNPQLHALRDWYMAPILPILLVATCFGLKRIQESWQPWAMGALFVCTAVGYWAYSPLPGGRQFDPVRYTITDHHQIAAELLQFVPDEASVMAQDAFTQHMSMRSDLHHLRWNSWEKDNYDYLVLDRNLRHYPFNVEQINNIIDERIADPTLEVVAEADGMIIFQRLESSIQAEAMPPMLAIADEVIGLEKVSISIADDSGVFSSETGLGLETRAEVNSQIRVTLYWRALGTIDKNRTVSVRLADATGWLIAQQDSAPSNGRRPTVAWEPDWSFRDVYYLEIPEGVAGGSYDLSVLLYDSADFAPVLLNGEPQLNLAKVTIEP